MMVANLPVLQPGSRSAIEVFVRADTSTITLGVLRYDQTREVFLAR
jgi:hypothetical protein